MSSILDLVATLVYLLDSRTAAAAAAGGACAWEAALRAAWEAAGGAALWRCAACALVHPAAGRRGRCECGARISWNTSWYATCENVMLNMGDAVGSRQSRGALGDDGRADALQLLQLVFKLLHLRKAVGVQP